MKLLFYVIQRDLLGTTYKRRLIRGSISTRRQSI